MGRQLLALFDAADDETPLGTPAVCINSTSNLPVAGVFSDGLKTTVLPAINAGMI
jgi:hypothetical protein